MHPHPRLVSVPGAVYVEVCDRGQASNANNAGPGRRIIGAPPRSGIFALGFRASR